MIVVKSYQSIKHWLSNQLLFQKLQSPLGFGILAVVAIALSYVLSLLDFKYGVVVLAGILGLPVVAACIYHQKFSVYLILVISIFVELFRKYNIPFGTALDILLFISFFGILIHQVKERRTGFASSPISAWILVWVFYNLIQVLNPWAGSQMAWMYTVRSMAGLILFYFIACFAFTNLKTIVTTFKLIIGLAFLSAAYGLKQEFFGFTPGEMAWLYADPERFQLIFQWSRLRIFSFFSDPTNYGIYMAYMGTLCFIMFTGPFKKWQRAALFIGGCCMFLSMAYAGSRTPFVLVPFGLIVFTMLTMSSRVILAMGMVFLLGAGVMMKSTSSAVMYRIQSAFDPTKSDDTVKVRFENQKLIQPFIYQHPFGAGLGSSGLWGKRFTPDSFLAGFAHDSGFVRIAVELGWIGLILYCIFLFVSLKTAIYYYLRVKNPKIKAIYLGLTVMFFQLTLANYPQEAIVQLPTSIIFYVSLAMLVKLKEFDYVELGEGEVEKPEVALASDQVEAQPKQLEPQSSSLNTPPPTTDPLTEPTNTNSKPVNDGN